MKQTWNGSRPHDNKRRSLF